MISGKTIGRDRKPLESPTPTLFRRLIVKRIFPLIVFVLLLIVVIQSLMLWFNGNYQLAINSPSGDIPHRLILNWTDNPATSVSVTWRTAVRVETPLAEIALADASPNFVTWRTQVDAETQQWEQGQHTAYFHTVTFTDLKPATLYAYRVGSRDVRTEWHQFQTANTTPTPFTFIYFGDAQTQLLSLWARTIRNAVLNTPRADFLLYAGDLVNRGKNDQDWQEWFQAAGWIHSQIPVLPSPGNHEYHLNLIGQPELSPLWYLQFTLPKNGPVGLKESTYYVDYQGARIISLNSNENIDLQAGWLETVLADNPHRWTFLTFHHPINSASGRRNNKKLRRAWKPLIDRYQIDLVLQGHDHAYARGGLLGDSVKLRDKANGTVYVVSVSGPKQYRLRRASWMTRAAENTQLYQVISVDGDRLSYRAMTVTGDVYDQFDLIKRDGKPNQLIENLPIDRTERRFSNTLKRKIRYFTVAD